MNSMQPLPTNPEKLSPAPARRSGGAVPTTLELGPTGAGSNNQRRGSCPTQRAYPWLLGISTLLAGAFCYLYITKPVIGTDPAPAPSAPAAPALAATPEKSGPATEIDGIPDEAPSRPAAVAPEALAESRENPYEETNLRIQHILGATGPADEDLGRITLDVPVLYQSGVVRWSEGDVAKARSLLGRIHDYRQRSRALRDEAVSLISEWDELIIDSIPDSSLRADSPTVPENQGAGSAEHAPLNSTEAIEIEAR